MEIQLKSAELERRCADAKSSDGTAAFFFTIQQFGWLIDLAAYDTSSLRHLEVVCVYVTALDCRTLDIW